MSNKSKLIHNIEDRLRTLEGDSFVIILGQKEYAELKTIDTYGDMHILDRTILGHKFKVVYLSSTIDIVSEDTFKAMMDMNKREIMDGLSRLNTQFAYVN